MILSMIFTFLPGAGAVTCHTCFDQLEGCLGGNACPFLVLTAANALVMAGTQGANAEISCAGLLSLRIQRVFTRTILNCLQMIARRPPPGTPVDLAARTVEELGTMGNNNASAIPDVLRELNTRLATANATDIARIRGICDNLRTLEVSGGTTAAGVTSQAGAMLGVYSFIFAKALAVVRTDAVTTTVVGVAIEADSVAPRSSTSVLSAKLLAPSSFAACADALHVWQEVCHATGLANILLTSPFLRTVFFDAVAVHNEPWQVGYTLFLVYLEKVETTVSASINLHTVFDSGSQDTLMQQAKQRARSEFGAHIFRSTTT